MESEDGCGLAGLFMAAQNNHAECIRILLAAGADANAGGRAGVYQGALPLHAAAQYGNTAAAAVLLAGGADVARLRDVDGLSAAQVARGNGHEEVAELLQDDDADVSSDSACSSDAGSSDCSSEDTVLF